MKKTKRKKPELKKEDYPKTFQLLKDLEELLKDPEEYDKW